MENETKTVEHKEFTDKEIVIVENDKYIVSWWHDNVRCLWGVSKIFDIYYYLKTRFIKKYYLIDTKFKRDCWMDSDTKILYGMMSILVDFVEKEKPLERVDWDTEIEHQNAKNEFMTIYEWWKNYPNREKEIDNALSKWYNESIPERCKNILNLDIKNTTLSKQLMDHLNILEEQLANEEQEMLIRLIKIRKYLWT